MDLYCNTTNEMLYNIPSHLISTVFQPYFASTIAGIQGAKIEEPFSIWEMEKPFDNNLLNSATGRATCRDHVHFSNTDPNHVYEWATCRKLVILDSRPCHNSNGYNNTSRYVVTCKEIPIYRGHTIQDLEARLQEHWDVAKKILQINFIDF